MTENLLFLASKLLAFFIRPENWIAIVLVLAFLALLTRRVKTATSLVAILLGAFFVLGVFPVADGWMEHLEGQYPAEPTIEAPKVIVILGGAEATGPSLAWGTPNLNDAADRVIAGVRLARRFPQAPILFTGGNNSITSDPSLDGGLGVIETLLTETGIAQERLMLGDTARTTAEHPSEVQMLLNTHDMEDDGLLVLVTSASHMPRAVAVMCSGGFTNIIPYPTDFRTTPGQDLSRQLGWDPLGQIQTIRTVMHEWLGTTVYKITGRIANPLPPGCPQGQNAP